MSQFCPPMLNSVQYQLSYPAHYQDNLVWSNMCGGEPCVRSVFGVPLQRSVLIIGFIELGITIIATILNTIKYVNDKGGYDKVYDCKEEEVCLGPLLKYAFFDAFTGIICALMLIFGSRTNSRCLLISWMIITVFASFKYIWVVLDHDWTALEVNFHNFYQYYFFYLTGLHIIDIPALLHLRVCHHLFILQRV